MNLKNSMLGIVATGLMGLAGISTSSAELPMLQEKEWLGYFMGIETNDSKFGITPAGEAWIIVMSKKGDPVSSKLRVLVDFQVEQVMPDGKIIVCAILPQTLESAQAPAVDPKQTVIRGKVKGGASFEMTVENGRNGLLAGGRILEPGTLTANPLRFSIAVKFPNIYEAPEKGGGKKDIKKQDETRKDDLVQLTMANQKKMKLSTTEIIDASSKEINGPGIMGAEITFSRYQGKKFVLAASPNSSLVLSNKIAGPLEDGFTVTWRADTAKDPNGNARMSIVVK
jgi:hypothetical protein